MAKTSAFMCLPTEDQDEDHQFYTYTISKLEELVGPLQFQTVDGGWGVAGNSPSEFSDYWATHYAAVEGAFGFRLDKWTPVNGLGMIQIRVSTELSDVAVKCFTELASQFEPDLATLVFHAWDSIPDEEEYLVNLPTDYQDDGIPDVPWMLFLGARFVDELTSSVIRNAGFLKTSSLGAGILCQLTESWFDCVRYDMKYQQAKLRVRESIGESYFFPRPRC